MAKTKKHKWKSSEVVDLLRERYGKAGNGNSKRYVFVEQVAPATGFSHMSTWIDAMVFSMWPSEGLNREAFEVKVSRADFLNEINNPTKNAWFKVNSHMFWYVTAPGVVAAADEIPEGCGWMLAQTGRLVIKKQATKRQIEEKIDAEFFAAVARAMDREVDECRRRMRAEVLEEPDINIALDAVDTLKDFFRRQGTVPTNRRYSQHLWETKEELSELLQRALAGAGEAKLADTIDARARYLRDKIGDLLLLLTPYAAELLHDVQDLGGQVSGYMGRGDSFDILDDLVAKAKKPSRYAPTWEKRNAKARVAFMRQLLGLAEQAEEATMHDPGDLDHA